MTQLKDVIHYYIGQSVYLCDNLEGNRVIEPLTAKMLAEDLEMFYDEELPRPYTIVLRRLEDMTEHEAIALVERIVHADEFVDVDTTHNSFGDLMVTWRGDEYNATGEKTWSSEQFHYLLKQGFDLWGLIDSNQAIDAKTLNQKV